MRRMSREPLFPSTAEWECNIIFYKGEESMRRVVITGIGVISAVGNNVDEFWSNITAGKSGIDKITKFDTTEYKAKLAAEVKGFNPEEHGIPKRQARKMDQYAIYALAAAKQAVAMSGIAENVAPEMLGVYVSSGIGGMETFVNETNKLSEKGPSRISPFFIPMMILNMASGNISMEFNAQGPSLPVVTACATSTHAVGEAMRAISGGYADAIIAGGAEATVNGLAIAGFTSCQALTLSEDKDRASIPFDKERNGFVMGEGAGILVLEELEHAKKRGANIIAEVCGYGNTCDAFHITAPREDGACATRAITQAISQANYTSEDVVYVNAHGTSTPLNDKIETLCIKNAFGEEKAKEVLISSTKSMTGHMLGAAGGVEAIIAALSIKNSIAPPTAGLKVRDEDCDLNYLEDGAKKAEITLAISNSMGFGGHNACIAMRPYK